MYRYLEVLNKEKLRTEKIDACLQCIPLHWCRTEGEVEGLSLAFEFGIVAGDLISGRLRTIGPDTAISRIQKSIARCLTPFEVYDDDLSWESDLFMLTGSTELCWKSLTLKFDVKDEK